MSFTDLCIPHFAVESASKFSFTRSLEDGFVGGAQFSKWHQIKSIPKCKYLFPSILP